MSRYQASMFGRSLLRVYLSVVLSALLSSCVSGGANPGSEEQVKQSDESVLQPADMLLEVNIHVVNKARSIQFMSAATTAVSALFEKCQITLLTTVRSAALAPDTPINRKTRDRLVAKYAPVKPALFVIPSTAELDVAFSYLPSLNAGVAGTSWLTDRVSDRCFVWIMAHELGHVIFDHAKHSAGFSNIMSAVCKQKNWGSRQIAPDWTDEQCVELRGSNAVRQTKVTI